jgi:hypothetical protein
MVQIVWRTRTVYSNVYQSTWGSCSDCSEWFQMEPMELGGIRVTTEEFDEGGRYATFTFGGISFTTEISGKRIYHHCPQGNSDACNLSDMELVAWFNRVIADLDRVDQQNCERLIGRSAARKGAEGDVKQQEKHALIENELFGRRWPHDHQPPAYSKDLNLCAEAEARIAEELGKDDWYFRVLFGVANTDPCGYRFTFDDYDALPEYRHRNAVCATAEQRVEAIVELISSPAWAERKGKTNA